MRPLAASILALITILAGCAQRQLTIRSEPAGAIVYLNGEEVGRTPMKYDFTFYGDYDVILRKEGFETLKTSQNLKAPLSGIPPFDFFGELFGSKDRREWIFNLSAVQPALDDPQSMVARAKELSRELRSGQDTRPPSTAPTTLPATTPAP